MVTLISSKKLGVCNNMRNTVSLLAQKLGYQIQIYDIHPIPKFWESASN
jgi:hypothetical protein